MPFKKIARFEYWHSLPPASIIAGILGISAGFYLLTILSLPRQLMLLFMLGAFSCIVAMILGNVQRLLLAFIVFDIGLNLDFNLLYNHEAAKLGAIGGFSISITTLALIALYALWLGKIFTGIASPPRYLLKASLPPAVFMTSIVLSAFVARNSLFSLFEIALIFQMFLLYIYIVGTVRTRQDLLFVVAILMMILFFESLIMIALKLKGSGFQFAGINARIDGGHRVAGTVGSPVDAASFLQLLLIPAISIFFAKAGRLLKAFAFIALILGGISLILTLTRGGWIAFALSVVILLIFAWYFDWLSPKLIFGIVFVMIVLPLLFQDVILNRFFGYDHGSAMSRFPLMALAMRIIQDYPLLGVGANNFSLVVEDFASKGFINAWIYVVHNKYLLVAAETGVIGLTAFALFLLATLRRGWQVCKFNDRLLSPLALGFTVAIVGHMTHWLVDVFHSRPQMQIFWTLAALISAIRYMDQRAS